MKKNKKRKICGSSKQLYWGLLLLLTSPIIGMSASRKVTVELFQQQTQQFKIKGVVTDQKGVPLPGVSIRLENTSLGVATDSEGRYTILVPQTSGYLVFSFVGYKILKQQFEVGRIMKVKLSEDIAQLDEVKVVAYGSQKVREITGSISSVKAADFEGLIAPDIESLLQGQMAGVNMMNASGDAGGRKIVTVRGMNGLAIENLYSDPLYIIDGVPVYSFTSKISGLNTLAEIDPASIESVEVLKDAAASSLYGARAANGVILITTKKGRYNQKPVFRVSYSHTFGSKPFVQEATGGVVERRTRMAALNNYQQTVYDEETNTFLPVTDYWTSYVNGVEYGYFWGMGEGKRLRIYQDSLNPFYNNSTNMNTYIFQRSKIDKANLRINGGADNVTYSMGLGWYSEEGSVRKTGFERLNLESNLTLRPFKVLESNVSFYVSHTKRKKSPNISGDFMNNEGLAEIPEEAFSSTLLPGEGTVAFEKKMEQLNKIDEKNQSNRLRASFDLNLMPLRGLKAKYLFAVDYTEQKQQYFAPAAMSEYNEPKASQQHAENAMLLNEGTISYDKSIHDQHNISVLAGISYQVDQEISYRGFGSTPSDQVKWVDEGSVEIDGRIVKNYFSSKEKSKLLGLFGRLNYNYKGRYLMSFTFRRDGSSKFGEDVKFGNFPSVSLGYILTDEPFMEKYKTVLSYFKIRASVGKSGNTPRQCYIPFGIIEPKNSFLGHATMGPFWQEGLENRNLTWEKTTQYNVGLDFTLFNHKLNFIFDVYRRDTKGALASVQIPSNTSGYYWHWYNAFGIRNSGLELTLRGDILNTSNLRWKFSLNMARNWNKFLESFNDVDFQTTGNFGTHENNINIIGKPLNQILAYQTKGYYTSQDQVPYTYVNGVKKFYGTISQIYQPGDIWFADNDGNNTLTSNYPTTDDRIICGSPLPILQGGVSTSFTYKNFELNLLFNYVVGRHILNAAKGSSIGTRVGIFENDIAKKFLVNLSDVHYWNGTSTHANAPANRLETGLNNFNTFTSDNVENVSFLRLKNIMLAYNFRLKNPSLKIRLYVSGENIFMLTNYTGRDPEAVDPNTGIDYGKTYPLARKGTIGIDITF